jgi:hypothetical protein
MLYRTEPHNNLLYVSPRKINKKNMKANCPHAEMESTEIEHEKAEGDLFNDLMDYVGTEGKFQSRFNYLYNMALMVIVALPALNIVLALTSPDHWCHVPGRNTTNFTSSEWKELTIPR